MAVATCAFAGCAVNANPRWQVPVRLVVRELCAWFNVRSFPGSPEKSLACFAMIDHVYVPRGHGTRALTDTDTDVPGATDTFRSRTVEPTSVAVPDDGVPTDRGTNPGGNVRFADPSCWVEVSLVSVAVNVGVEPAATPEGEITAAYGFFGPAMAGTTKRVRRTIAARSAAEIDPTAS
jgi:hypothetical protein